MAITRYQPATELLSPLFDDFVAPFRRMGSMMRVPETDVIESEDEIRVIVELPGLKSADVDVSLEGNILTVSGEKQEGRAQGDERATYHLSERRWGKFTRSFVLPREVEQDRIEAHFEDGVITVTIPKSERARRRQIQVTSGDGQARSIEGVAGAR